MQESRKNRFFVTTRTDNKYLQYIVVKKNNKYLIDSKKRRFLNEDKWFISLTTNFNVYFNKLYY